MRKPKTADIVDSRTEGVRDVPLTEIDIPEDRARSFDAGEAEGLAFIIAASGLQHPIRVRPVGNRFRLIAGRKRLEAFRLLEWETIPATISTASNDDEARLEEVMENLGRVELKTLDRCQHLFELKQVHERIYPETKNGGDRGNQHTGGRTQKMRSASDSEEVFGFAASTAEKIGLSRRTVELAVKIWTDLTPDSRLRCAGTRLADHQSGLKELSEQSPADQAKILDMLLADPPVATTVSEAVAILANGVALTPMEKKVSAVRKALHSLPEPVANALAAPAIDARLDELQKSIATLSKFFGGLKDDELDRVIADHEERIIASLKRRGAYLIMSRARCPLTKDLLTWEAPQVAVRYSEDVIGRGQLDNKIARVIAQALRDALDNQGLSREAVAGRISEFLNRKVSADMLYKWTSESSKDHRIPLDAFIALVHATQAKKLLGFVPGEFGLMMVEANDYELIEERMLEDHIEEMQALRQALAARRKAKR